MSATNGDKSRFHRMRKQRIARRERIRELNKQAAERAATPPAKG